jgi:hypothetical protein
VEFPRERCLLARRAGFDWTEGEIDAANQTSLSLQLSVPQIIWHASLRANIWPDIPSAFAESSTHPGACDIVNILSQKRRKQHTSSSIFDFSRRTEALQSDNRFNINQSSGQLTLSRTHFQQATHFASRP